MSDHELSLLTHFLNRLHKDITRIESLIQIVHNDVHFLVEAGQIDNEDAAIILSKVPSPAGNHEEGHSSAALVRSINTPDSPQSVTETDISAVDNLAPPSYPSLETVHKPVPKRLKQARALWSYNTDGEELHDLIFHKGDIIEVLSEENEDWWTGKINGRIGIFPSNYVEVLEHPPLINWGKPAPPAPLSKSRPVPEPAPMYPQYQYKPEPPHVARNKVVDDDLKKPKMRHTMANSAAGGLGFGAGAAMGGSVVRAIF